MRLEETLRPEVVQFALDMEYELSENDHKGGWENDEPGVLLNRLIEETYELAVELHASPLNREAVVKEAADVANFCLMIADVVRNSSVVD